ncbi:acetyltransferase [Phlyctema vagabunda]|uniref:Acetyltransferase n=1 Tax=Phlyctema vagabunda TaxID=108571 RepID=A0ABR4PQ92_9HELO
MTRSAPTLLPDFELLTASIDDIDELFHVFEAAYVNDEVWRPLVRDVKPEDVHPWLMGSLASRYKFPDIESYKIVEKASGKIAAWTALQYPWEDRPLDPEQKAFATSHDLPPLVEGVNVEALKATMETLTCTHEHGYNADIDFHRKGTMVHPDFQKKGFGSVLTHHCNEISDKAGKKTYLPARPTSRKMFESFGYRVLGKHDSHVERWGENPARGITCAMVREVGGV